MSAGAVGTREGVRADAGDVVAAAPGRRRRPHRLSLAVLVAGLVMTAVVSAVSRVDYLRNEHRQVVTQAQLAGSALAVAPVDVQRQLGRATTLMAAAGRLRLFDDALAQSVPESFVGVRLFRTGDGAPRLVHSLGSPTQLDLLSAQGRGLVRRALTEMGSLAVTRVATAETQRLGYAYAARVEGRTYLTYAEQSLPANRRGEIPADSPLSGMTFALYYGKAETSEALIEANTGELPLPKDAGRVTVPFGDRVLSAAMIPQSPLLGTLAQRLPWLIAGAGVLLTALMTLLVERLARRRAVAEQLAAVTGQLYQAQRGVAETLQTALLPSGLPRPRGLAVATRYLTGTDGIEVGGDWYDLLELSDGRLFFTIGDVSGRGLSAATMMSRLRHSISAYALDGNDPATVLGKVSALVDLGRDGHFATALCGVLDVRTGRVTVANAGHPPLLLVTDGTAGPVDAPVHPPLGIGSRYTGTEVALAPGSVVLAYTDGLVERRDEPVDAGIARLCRAAAAPRDLESLLDSLVDTLVPRGAGADDTAILGLQWNP